MESWLRVDPADNVGTALVDIGAGSTVHMTDEQIRVLQDIPRGHKIALRPMSRGDAVIKFGFPIGRATGTIARGEHVHSHNLATALTVDGEYRYLPSSPPKAPPSSRVFQGYRREDDRVATRNEIWVLPTVGCVARTAERIAADGARRHVGRIDGIHAFQHPLGCSQLGDDLNGTRRLLAALANHPNAAGVLIIGLGCEENQLDDLVSALPPGRRPMIRHLTAQFEPDELARGASLLDELVDLAALFRRTPVPLSQLSVGVKCGGSDGLSGLTANPLIGRITDAVTEAGGTAILTEIPEIFGAEQLLMDRAIDADVFDRTVRLVNDFKRYFVEHGQPVSENPSPGNIAGGITTLEEKSLGAVQKGGHAPVTDVIRYGEQVRRTGLTLLEAPGNDAVSSTALTAAGATLILFSTGRGTPLGFPSPTLKIASNSALARRKAGWIDFDAGQVLTDGMNATTEKLLDTIVGIASGRPTASENNGEREIAIWKRGVTL